MVQVHAAITAHEDVATQIDRFRGHLWTYASQHALGHTRQSVIGQREEAPDEDADFARIVRKLLLHSTGSLELRSPIGETVRKEEPEDVVRSFGDSLSRLEAIGALVSLVSVKSETTTPGIWSNVADLWPPFHAFAIAHEIDAVTTWTSQKNRRRCQLVDREIAGTISPEEHEELLGLQEQMLAYRRKVAPLPLDDLRELHQELLEKAAEETDQNT